MVIDEKGLNTIAEHIRLFPHGTHAIMVEKRAESAWILDADSLAELIRLARLGLRTEQATNRGARPQDVDLLAELLRLAPLGLWAEKHAVPALRKSDIALRELRAIHEQRKGAQVGPDDVASVAGKALAVLPKEV